MVIPPATRLIECNIQTEISRKWSDFVDGGNGCLYGIPYNARRVLQFNIEDKSVMEIGPDLGCLWGKYQNGIRANNGSIYCLPWNKAYFLKITPIDGHHAEVHILKDREIFERRYEEERYEWKEGVLVRDGCIYYLPYAGYFILRLDPNDGDSLSLVGRDTGGTAGIHLYETAVTKADGCIYGVSDEDLIIFNPTDCSINVVYVYHEDEDHFDGAVLADDGNIYSANEYGQVLKFDIANSTRTVIGSEIHNANGTGWGRPVYGADKNIYFPPSCHNRVIKFNPSTRNISLLGDSHGFPGEKWYGAVLASDGFIYCIPHDAHDILQIDSRHINEQILEFVDNIQAIA